MRRSAAILAFAALLSSGIAQAAETTVKWQSWTDEIFERARREQKMVLLDLEAVWCHWCHVMDAETYHDSDVVALIERHFIPVRVDQDSRPDIANRYERWGWPATILFGPDGSEIVKLRGYYAPARFAHILQATIDDPSPVDYGGVFPESDLAHVSQLPAERRDFLENFFREAYDETNAGWGNFQKFLDPETMTYVLERARGGDAEAARRASATLFQSFKLIDPVWGGAYQYSDRVDWTSPHFEKIMAYQAAYLRIYSMAYALWGEPRYRKAADDIVRYLRDFLLAPDGGFYTSQDADLSHTVDGQAYYALGDAERRRLGMPRIDMHQYARENGWAIGALAAYHDATGDEAALGTALRAAQWVLAHRSLPGGGFRHDAADEGGPFLGDSLSMGQAFLDLYRSTADRTWLAQARAAADFIAANFVDDETGGFLTATETAASPLGKPVKQREESTTAVRFFNLLSGYVGDTRYRKIAEAGMGYLVSPAVQQAFDFLPGVLLADLELTHEPVHVTVVGPKDDPAAVALHRAALSYPTTFKRAEWWDKREGKLPNHDVNYPEYPRSAAFACTRNFCSLPVTDPAKVAAALDRLERRLE